MVTKRAGQNAIRWSIGGHFRIQKSSEGEVGGPKIPRLKLINLRGRSRYFVQFTDEVFSSKMRVTLKHLHRLMTTDGRNLLVGQSTFDKPTHCLVTQVMKSEVR